MANTTQQPLGKLNEEYAQNILNLSVTEGSMPEVLLFYSRYKFYPQTFSTYFDNTTYLPRKKLLKILQSDYPDSADCTNDIIKYAYWGDDVKKLYVESQLKDFNNGVMICFCYSYVKQGELPQTLNDKDDDEEFDNEGDFLTSIRIMLLPHMVGFVEEFMSKIYRKRAVSKVAKLQMICRNQFGLYLTEIDIKKPKIDNLEVNYGKEFIETHETVLSALTEHNSTGIVLLHGLPGSGKTHYIRYLINAISEEKQLIYIPPDMTSCITSPEFLPFMLQQKDSILIIEDAENIIKSREDNATSNQAVANLLNLSDGLLGDSLQQPIIATFNCEINSIDPALLRKGRLIAHHEFGKLNVENAQALSDQLGFKSVITEPMTLADIYGQSK